MPLTTLFRFIVILLLTLIASLLSPPAQAVPEQLLWRIGNPDSSYDELAIARKYKTFQQAFPKEVKFEVGLSTWATAWPYIHPGPVDIWGGYREHPYEIVFQLAGTPQGAYTLQVDVVDTQMDIPPTLGIRVNGTQVNTVAFARGVGERTISDPKGGKKQSASIYIPRTLLHQGRNTITLTNIKNSWLAYDCVALMQRAEAQPIENLSVKSTVFFKQRGRALKQILTVGMDNYAENCPQAHLTLESKAWRIEQELKDLAPGARREIQIETAPIDTTTTVRVTMLLGGKRFSADCQVQPQKRWKFYILAQSHFDLGYTGVQAECLKVHRSNTEHAIDWMGKYPDFVWTMESKLAQDYMQHGTRPDKFIEYAKKGRFGVQGMYANILTGLCSGEELSHTIDYYDTLRQRHGIESRCMTMSDVPSMVATLPMILREHGIRYLSLGGNPFRGPLRVDDYETPYYWASPDGSRVLMHMGLNLLGVVPKPLMHQVTMAAVDEMMGRFLPRPNYPFDALLLHGFYTDNSNIDEGVARIAGDWNKEFAYPRLIESRGTEYFEYIEKNFAGALKTTTGDGGAFWEDGAGSSAFESAETRVAKEQLATAEKLVALSGAPVTNAFQTRLIQAWENAVLYDEHTWGDGNSVYDPFTTTTLAQWAGKKKFADDAASSARQLLTEATGQFAASVTAEEDSILVFNPSSWERSERVELTGTDGKKLSLLATGVPPLGYKLFACREAQAVKEKSVEAATTLENQYYQISFDPKTGAIASIRDKQLNRELIDAGTYRANEYVVTSGAEGSNLLRGFKADLGEPKLRINRCVLPTFKQVRRPGCQVMQISSTAPLARRFSAEVILRDDQKRIDFINMVDKDANLLKEGGYFAFPLAFTNPKIRMEIPSGVIRPNLDQLESALKDWYSVQHFVTVSDEKGAVAWSAIDSPLVTLQDVNRGQCYTELPLKNGAIFAYVFNNYWETNYRAWQSGPLTFRFALTSAPKISDVDAKRFGESVQAPLVCRFVKGQTGPQGVRSKGLVTIECDGVVVQALKPARFVTGTVLVLREMNGQSTKVRVKTPGVSFKKAYLSNLAEDPIKRLPVHGGVVEVPCRALGLATVILE